MVLPAWARGMRHLAWQGVGAEQGLAEAGSRLACIAQRQGHVSRHAHGATHLCQGRVCAGVCTLNSRNERAERWKEENEELAGGEVSVGDFCASRDRTQYCSTLSLQGLGGCGSQARGQRS